MKSLFGFGIIKIGKVDQNLDGFISVRVDRKTIFGNPYPLSKYTRDKACDLYAAEFKDKYRDEPDFKKAVDKLKKQFRKGNNLLLQCHCQDPVTGKGKRCHAQTIKKFIEG